MKVVYVAAALVVSIGPASAAGLVAPERGIVLTEAGPAGPNRTEAAPAQSKDTAIDAEAPLFAAGADGREADAGTSDPASEHLSAALKAKIRSIIAFVQAEARNSPDGSALLRSRIKVHCSVREVVRKSKPSLTAAPTLMLSERAETKRVSATLEACTIKLLQLRRSELVETPKRGYAVELPAPDAVTP